MATWAEQVAKGKFDAGRSDAVGAKADDPGRGTLYDTSKFNREFWGEEKRVAALESLGMLDSPREQLFDQVTALLMKIFDTQCSHLVLIDPNRCWFKSWQGRWKEFETDTDHGRNVECPREDGWCNYILVPDFAEVLIIEDATKDARLALNPFVIGPPHFCFYAGAPLVGSRGERYGTLCVADFQPRTFAAEQYSLLINYAHLVVEELERDKPAVELLSETSANYVERSRFLDLSIQASQQGVCMVDMRDTLWPLMFANDKFLEVAGVSREEDVKKHFFWHLFSDTKTTPLELSIATGLGDTFEMDIRCQQTDRDLHVRLLPGTSDRLAPSKATAIPGWVPSQEWKPFSQDVHARISTGGTEMVRDCKCFWFVIISESVPLTAGTLAATAKAEKSQKSEKEKDGDSILKGGYKMERRMSNQSSTTAQSTAQSIGSGGLSSLSSSWTSFYGDYPLPTKLNGKVEMGPLLGSGSFGKAYRGISQDKPVAVKVVDCRRRDDNAIKDQLREVQLSASMEHENVVRTLDYATSSGRTKKKQIDILWIIQELCDMGDLVSATERGLLRVDRKITSPADLKTIISVLMDVAKGMEFVHSCNVIHSDLTGRNVLLSSHSDGVGFCAKVADFGLARYSIGCKALPAKDIGTVTHVPPELMDPEGGELVRQADVWAYGVLAWEAYHGKRCYQGKNPAQIAISIFRGNTPQWSEDAGELAVLMKKCISYEIADRPVFSEVIAGLRNITVP